MHRMVIKKLNEAGESAKSAAVAVADPKLANHTVAGLLTGGYALAEGLGYVGLEYLSSWLKTLTVVGGVALYVNQKGFDKTIEGAEQTTNQICNAGKLVYGLLSGAKENAELKAKQEDATSGLDATPPSSPKM